MRLHRASAYRRSRWKNGKGETLEIAIYPPTATIDDFDWRISVALLEADAEFSEFPDIDRTLAIIDGDGIVLDLGYELHKLDQDAPFIRFAGDHPARAKLVEGPSADLNVMTRRGLADHLVQRLVPRSQVKAGEGFTGVFAQCDAELSVADAPLFLARWDMLELVAGETAIVVAGRTLEVRIEQPSS